MTYRVEIYSDEVAFRAEVVVQAASDAEAQAAAQSLVRDLKLARQIGPVSWEYEALLVGAVRPL